MHLNKKIFHPMPTGNIGFSMLKEELFTRRKESKLSPDMISRPFLSCTHDATFFAPLTGTENKASFQIFIFFLQK